MKDKRGKDKIDRLLAQHALHKDVQHAAFQIENAIDALEDAAAHVAPAMELDVDQLELSSIVSQLRDQKRCIEGLVRSTNPMRVRRSK